jgi:tripartite-type tricarboxylate transporter receptor subunit TctC
MNTPLPNPSRRALLGLATLPLLARGAAAAEAPWPDRPVRIIIPVAPGGSLDILGRSFARQLTGFLGQPVVAENHPGAGSNLAFELVARARPDGHTLLVASDPLAINPGLYPRVGYDPARDFAGVSELVRAPQVLVVRSALPATDVAGFLRLAAQAEGGLTMASQGNGSIGHLAGAVLARRTGLAFTHVPYRGGGPAVIDLVAGHIDALLVTLPAAIEHIRAGRIRALAVTSATRSAALPEAPTLAESGLPGFDIVTWQGLAAPAGTPAPILARLHAGIAAALARPELREDLTRQGFTVTGTTPDAFTDLIRAEAARWPGIVRLANARVE